MAKRKGLLSNLTMKVQTPYANGRSKLSEIPLNSGTVTVRDAIKNAVFLEASQQITDEYMATIKEAEREASDEILLRAAEISSTVHERKLEEPYGKKTTKVKDKIPDKYLYVAKLFCRLVTRTPYDEKYYFEKKDGTYGYHLPDKNKCRENWKLEIKGPGVNDGIYVTAFKNSGVSFESLEFEDNDAYTIAKILMKKLHRQNFTSFKFSNMNDHVDVLEFGRYTINNSKQIKEGPYRPHGIVNRYSIQAPRGFIRLTMTEIENTTYTEEGELDLEKSFSFNYNLDFSVEDPLKKCRMIDSEFGKIDEHRIYKALWENKKVINNDKEMEEYNRKVNEEIEKQAKVAEEQAKKKALEIERKKTERQNKKRKTNKISAEIQTPKTYSKADILGRVYVESLGNEDKIPITFKWRPPDANKEVAYVGYIKNGEIFLHIKNEYFPLSMYLKYKLKNATKEKIMLETIKIQRRLNKIGSERK